MKNLIPAIQTSGIVISSLSSASPVLFRRLSRTSALRPWPFSSVKTDGSFSRASIRVWYGFLRAKLAVMSPISGKPGMKLRAELKWNVASGYCSTLRSIWRRIVCAPCSWMSPIQIEAFELTR